MTTPVVTVLITTYNYGQFIEQAIDSILSQDYPLDRIQILVVDDGSTDDTSERVKKYGSRVDYFKKSNGGQASALNVGLAKARGEIVALLDADDLFMPGKLARVTKEFEQDPALGMVYHQLEEWYTRTGERHARGFSAFSGDVKTKPEEFALYVPQPTSAVSFRRRCVQPFLPIPESIRMLADCYLVALFPFVGAVRALAEPLAVYRIHGANQYAKDSAEIPPHDGQTKLEMWKCVKEEMRWWLAINGYTEEQPIVRALLDRWSLYEDFEEFPLKPPSRIRLFRHLMRYNRCYRRQMTWRRRTFHYFSAGVSLVTGYRLFLALREWRLNVVEGLPGVLRPWVSRDHR